MCAFCSYNFDVSFFSVQLTVTSTAAIIYVINCCSLFIRCNYTCIVGLLCLIPMLSSCACILSDVRVCGEGGPGVRFHDWTDMGGGWLRFFTDSWYILIYWDCCAGALRQRVGIITVGSSSIPIVIISRFCTAISKMWDVTFHPADASNGNNCG